MQRLGNLPPDNASIVNKIVAGRFRQLMLGQQMTECRNIGQKIEDRLINNDQTSAATLYAGNSLGAPFLFSDPAVNRLSGQPKAFCQLCWRHFIF